MGFDWGVLLAIVVFVVVLGGVEVLIAVRYKQRTGRDHRGSLFWKRVLRRPGNS